jgi:hypothetical protein
MKKDHASRTKQRRLNQPDGDNAWDAWQMLIDQLVNESKKKRRSAVVKLGQMRR